MLFLIFINDMPLYINEAYTEIYADDTTVHTSHKDQTVVQVRLQNSSTYFKYWCILHKMFVNLTKTSSMSTGSRQNGEKLAANYQINRIFIFLETFYQRRLLPLPLGASLGKGTIIFVNFVVIT